MEYLKFRLLKIIKEDKEQDQTDGLTSSLKDELSKFKGSRISQKITNKRAGQNTFLRINTWVYKNDTDENDNKSGIIHNHDVINDNTIEISMNDYMADSGQFKSQSLSSWIGSNKYQHSDFKSKVEENRFRIHQTHEGSNFGSAVNAMIYENINEEDTENEWLPTPIENKTNNRVGSMISVEETPSSLQTQPFMQFNNNYSSKYKRKIFQGNTNNSSSSSNNFLSIQLATPQNKNNGHRLSATQMMIENTLKKNNNLLSLLNRSNTMNKNAINNLSSGFDKSRYDSSQTNMTPSSKKV